jgi:hypothetical protein
VRNSARVVEVFNKLEIISPKTDFDIQTLKVTIGRTPSSGEELSSRYKLAMSRGVFRGSGKRARETSWGLSASNTTRTSGCPHPTAGGNTITERAYSIRLWKPCQRGANLKVSHFAPVSYSSEIESLHG